MPDEGRPPRGPDGRGAGNQTRRTRLPTTFTRSFTMQMINRLKELLQASPGAVLDDWFELEARGHAHVVTFDTALHVKLAVEQVPPPERVEFTDLFGTTHSLRPQDVLRISESTPGTRARVRAFLRAREAGGRSGQQSANAQG